MPHRSWTAKRERQYLHVKDSLLDQGPGGRTWLQLRHEARQRGLEGRSTMNKAQLEAALQP